MAHSYEGNIEEETEAVYECVQSALMIVLPK